MTTIRAAAMSAVLSSTLLFAACAGGTAQAPTVPSPPTQAASEAAIGRLADAYITAWNAHDAHAFAQTYTPDGALTNVFGVKAEGRDNIETLVGAAFAHAFGASHQTLDDRTVRFLTPAMASVDLHWSLTGATVPGWPALQHGLQTWIVTQQPDGSWLIAVLHNQTLP
ncbi:MAG: SgcJ/EcaC family oxidoreductase [Candidatus Eremiobacteraeota bacterium]|nr:SgcJ/EcaC family oxidoreductase [Candidatus Eremiobacteraeota bacterium]